MGEEEPVVKPLKYKFMQIHTSNCGARLIQEEPNPSGISPSDGLRLQCVEQCFVALSPEGGHKGEKGKKIWIMFTRTPIYGRDVNGAREACACCPSMSRVPVQAIQFRSRCNDKHSSRCNDKHISRCNDKHRSRCNDKHRSRCND